MLFRNHTTSVLFYPRPLQHRFYRDSDGAEIVCAHIDFGAGVLQPLIQSLPAVMQIPIRSAKGMDRAVDQVIEPHLNEGAP